MSDSQRVEPAQLTFDADGVVRSACFDDVYHSADGAFAQARHVFVGGNRLPERWRGRASFTIVETGFGLGVNFLATWAALRADPQAPGRLHYIAAEKHPPEQEALQRFHAHHAHALAGELIRRWPPLTPGFHRIEVDGGRIALTLLIGDAAEMLAEVDAVADALYLDGFAPEKNPAMWSDALVRELARLSPLGTTAATWTVASAVRARMAAAGFRIDKQPGFGRKREMLVAEKAAGDPRPHEATPARHAVVLGAGLAGTWCAHALARRGWRIDLVERHPRPAQAASGNAVGAVRPALNLADNDNAQIARAAFLLATRSMTDLCGLAGPWSQSGVVHVATDAAQIERMARIDAAHRFPHEYVCAIDAREASRRAGHAVGGPGWWIARGGWAHPAGLCEALLRPDRGRIVRHFRQEAVSLAYRENTWCVIGPQASVIASAATLILAHGYGMSRWTALGLPPLVPVRGQVTHLPAHAGRVLDVVVCGDGYVAPLPDGGHCVGATFQPDDADDALRASDHVQNLARLERMLPGFGSGLSPAALHGRAAVRTATADRLPACGPLSGAAAQSGGGSGLYAVTGLGARGLIYAPLCAEVLAAHLEKEPAPLERRLLRALDPARLSPR